MFQNLVNKQGDNERVYMWQREREKKTRESAYEC